MPKKFHIETKRIPSRFLPVAKLIAFEREGCLGCLKCVKRSSCVYDAYRKRAFDPVRVEDSIDSLCLGCMRCVQECKKGILARAPNPALQRIGNEYWTPELLTSLWKQAETGAIPVSGAGYRGPFTGPGWDSMWTDMSEIVRPTRDGIHGREYISTSVDLGGKPDILAFDASGHVAGDGFRIVDIPLPMILEVPRVGQLGENVRVAMAKAAVRLGTLMVATVPEAMGILHPYLDRLILKIETGRKAAPPETLLRHVPVVEIEDSGTAARKIASLHESRSSLIVSVQLPLDERAADRVEKLARAGVDILHLEADSHGRGAGANANRFARDLVREVHLRLVERRLRDRVTLVLRGGIAMAEHVAKAIACGVDAVGAGSALMVALECRLCADRPAGCDPCPMHLEEVEPGWGEKRIVNLMGSWHSQLLEVLGAMGLREIRRLRGEVGRVMFFEDLERECFGPVFGKRKDSLNVKARDAA